MNTTLFLILILLAFINESCGTEIGNGVTPKPTMGNSSAPEDAQDSYAPEEEFEDNVIPDSPTNLAEQVGNTCASPAAYGATGTFSSGENEFTIEKTSETMFEFNSNGKIIAAGLDMGTEDPFDIEWLGEARVRFTCSNFETSTPENPQFIVESPSRLTFTISWTVVNDEIVSIMINNELFEKQAPEAAE